MAQWLRGASQEHDVYSVHDLESRGSNTGQVELWVHNIIVGLLLSKSKSYLNQNYNCNIFLYLMYK